MLVLFPTFSISLAPESALGQSNLFLLACFVGFQEQLIEEATDCRHVYMLSLHLVGLDPITRSHHMYARVSLLYPFVAIHVPF